jgi:hypothetical protein
MISKEEFHRNCIELIPQEEFDKIEELKKKEKRTNIIILIVGLIIVGLMVLTMGLPCLFFVIVVFIAMGISSAVFMINADKLKRQYAKQVIQSVLKDYNYTYTHGNWVSENIFKASPFNRDFDEYSGEDLLKIDIPKDDGTSSGVELQVSDLTLRKEYKSKDGTTSEVVFRGAFGYVKFPFEFKCNLGINVSFGSVKKITLEDLDFNNKFRVYTDNQVEALIVLTPVFMSKIKKFAKNVNVFEMYLTREGGLYFVRSRDLFELKVNKSTIGPAIFDNFYEDIADIVDMVEEIKNNNKIFKM